MKTTKIVSHSNCCNAPTKFGPPSLGDPGFFVCEKCNKECNVHEEEVVTHIKIGEGHYRPV